MDRIVVRGNGPLRGDVVVSGSKNSTLVLMAAALLADGRTRLQNVPKLRDVDAMLALLRPRRWPLRFTHGSRLHAARHDARNY